MQRSLRCPRATTLSAESATVNIAIILYSFDEQVSGGSRSRFASIPKGENRADTRSRCNKHDGRPRKCGSGRTNLVAASTRYRSGPALCGKTTRLCNRREKSQRERCHPPFPTGSTISSMSRGTRWEVRAFSTLDDRFSGATN